MLFFSLNCTDSRYVNLSRTHENLRIFFVLNKVNTTFEILSAVLFSVRQQTKEVLSSHETQLGRVALSYCLRRRTAGGVLSCVCFWATRFYCVCSLPIICHKVLINSSCALNVTWRSHFRH